MQQRPGRTILTVLSIVIGVTAAVAVSLGTATTRNAYKAMFALATGKATLEIAAKGGGRAVFSDALLEKVKAVPGIKMAAPVVDRPGSMSFGEGERVRLRIMGVDPKVDPLVRDYIYMAGRPIEKGYELALDEGLAKHLELPVGSKVKILGNGRLGGSKEFEVVGLFRIESGVGPAQLGMGLMPLETAQGHFNPRQIPKDSIDRIQIVTANETKLIEDVQKQIAAILPDTVEVHRPAGSTQLMEDTLKSSEQGLELTTLFSLFMAAFIILNTFLMNVSERRRHISIMRAIGATRMQIAGALLSEAMLLGLLGTVLGIAAGFGLAYFGTQIVSQAFDVQLPRLIEVLTIWPFVKGAVFGIVMAFLGAIIPSVIAAFVSPLEGMNRIVRSPTRSFTALLLTAGAVMTAGASWAIFECVNGRLPIETATWAALPLLFGLVLLDTAMLAPQVALAGWFLRLFSRVEATLAHKQILRNRLRSALTVAVLFIAGCTGVGIANSILDNVKDVHDWKSKALVADFYVRAMMPDMATGLTPDLPPEVGDDLEQVRNQKAPNGKPLLETLEGTNLFEIKVRRADQPTEDALTAIGLSREFSNEGVTFDLIGGDAGKIAGQILDGGIVIGSVLSQKTGLKAGDKLPIEAKTGIREVPIVGVANDYLVGGMSVYIHRKYAEEWLDAHGVDGYVIKVEPGNFDIARPLIDAVAKKHHIIAISQVDIGRAIDRFVGGTEWSLWLLVMMGFVVAAFGMVNTLTMNVLEQTRELGLLRIVAMTKTQVRRTIMMQALIIGCIGLPPGLAIGVVIAYVLNLTMMESFGHMVGFSLHADLLLYTLVGGIAIVVVAAWFPARRATRINVVEALHYE